MWKSLFAAAALSLLAFTAPARADVPPEPGFVESCTVPKAQKAGETCESCGGAYHGDREVCDRKYVGQPEMARRCQTAGGSVWDEVWCRPLKAGETPKVPSESASTPGASCGLHGHEGGTDPTMLALIVAGAGLACRRRSRRASVQSR
jgi:hypothetical protein